MESAHRKNRNGRIRWGSLAATLGIVLSLVVFSSGAAATGTTTVLTLADAVAAAQRNDPLLIESRHSEEAVISMSTAAGTLPDPTVTLGLANFPTDTFDIGQEAMTQIKVGVTQMLPRGESRQIKRRQLQAISERFPYERLDRRAKTVVKVGQLWLEAYQARESIFLIEADRPLFEQLADVAEAGYSSAIGRARQQDIIRAHLELTRLDDRLTMLKQKQESATERLLEWLYDISSHGDAGPYTGEKNAFPAAYELDRKMPDIAMLEPELYFSKAREPERLYSLLAEHPAVKVLEQQIEAGNLGVDLARQQYKPMWGVSASYAYRDDDPAGRERADFLSVGLSFDLPVFTANRQDKEVQAAMSQTEAVKARKWALLREMAAEFEQNRVQFHRLTERQDLYRSELLPQMHEQTEASLTAYTNDDGDFAEAVRARIAQLNTRLDDLEIAIQRQKTILRLNYYFMQNGDDIVAAGNGRDMIEVYGR
ncbi:MAG: TolC family protein [Desulfopila sp.]|nr:TolC family protein [Desulfopila sp.]